MCLLLRLLLSSSVLSSFNITVVAIAIVIVIGAIVIVNATTAPVLTTVKTAVGAIVAVLSLLQDLGCTTHQHVCYAQ